MVDGLRSAVVARARACQKGTAEEMGDGAAAEPAGAAGGAGGGAGGTAAGATGGGGLAGGGPAVWIGPSIVQEHEEVWIMPYCAMEHISM